MACLGVQLHAKVPPERWCVTRADLIDFREQCLAAVQEGRVLPTERDPFDPADEVFGPSIHTITDQLIKPTSAAHGDVSWALMQHAEGLPCDLFVTHGWQEGVFEFCDKVLSSWPPGARHAYCCMLANPQNLDVSSLISSPEASPFARALRSASVVLVVPNRRSSIYTRLWCVYEAFLACRWDKALYIAHRPLGSHGWAALRRFAALSCLGGAVLVALVSWLDDDFDVDLDAVPLNAAASLLAVHLRSPGWARVVNGLAGVISSWLFLASVMRVASSRRAWDELPGTVASLLAHAVWLCVPMASERRRFEDCRDALEGALLSHSGSTRDAICSNGRDEENIRAAIGADWAIVDGSVSVLVAAGMSTTSLRQAAAAGVDVRGAGRVSTPALCLNWVLWLWSSCFFAQLPFGSWLWFDAGCAVAWAAAWLRRPDDQKAFAASALAFLTLCRAPCVLLACTILGGYRRRYVGLAATERLAAFLLPCAMSLSLLQLLLLFVPLGLIARIPCVGPAVASTLLLRPCFRSTVAQNIAVELAERSY